MTAYRIADSLLMLRDQVNVRWPNRDKSADGFIGDLAHQATASDHNPTPDTHVVCAFDLTHDPEHGVNCDAIAESIRLHPHPDVKYVIWNHRMYSAYAKGSIPPFTWRPYSGDPHTSHIHVSVGVGHDGHSNPPYDDVMPWTLIAAPDTPATPLPPPPQEAEVMFVILRPGVAILVSNGKMVYLTAKALYTYVSKGVITIDLTADTADDKKQMASYEHQYGAAA